jgi:hypothetical protein
LDSEIADWLLSLDKDDRRRLPGTAFASLSQQLSSNGVVRIHQITLMDAELLSKVTGIQYVTAHTLIHYAKGDAEKLAG